MIKIVLTPLTLIADLINIWLSTVLSLIMWDGKFIEAIPFDNNFPWTNLLWARNKKQ